MGGSRHADPTSPRKHVDREAATLVCHARRLKQRGWRGLLLDGKNSDPSINRRVRELRRTILKALYEGGARILLGTDSPQIFSVPGFAMHREMGLWVDLGMTPYQVLESGTRRAAEYFDLADEFGSVAVGHRADLLLLTENPMEDIANVSKRAGVMVNGRWISEAQIQDRLADIATFYGN